MKLSWARRTVSAAAFVVSACWMAVADGNDRKEPSGIPTQSWQQIKSKRAFTNQDFIDLQRHVLANRPKSVKPYFDAIRRRPFIFRGNVYEIDPIGKGGARVRIQVDLGEVVAAGPNPPRRRAHNERVTVEVFCPQSTAAKITKGERLEVAGIVKSLEESSSGDDSRASHNLIVTTDTAKYRARFRRPQQNAAVGAKPAKKGSH